MFKRISRRAATLLALSVVGTGVWCRDGGRAAEPPPAEKAPPAKADAESLDAPPPPETVPGELLVRFRPRLAGLSRAGVVRLAGVQGQEVASPRPFRRALQGRRDSVFTGLLRLRLTDPNATADAMARLRARPEVAWVEPNYVVRLAETDPPEIRPNDFEFPRQWALENTGQMEGVAGADLRAPAAWALVHDASAVRVAVIDSGIDYFHPDLEPNVWVNPGEIPGNGLDDDGNGYVDDVHGYDFVSGDGDPMDDQGHGTHVAGIIGARGDNDRGVTGLCWTSTLMAVKSFNDEGRASVADVVDGIEYAMANGARLINASWGLPEQSLALQEAIQEAAAAGVLVISAAGNSRNDDPFYPAALDDVIAVAATDNRDERAGFSNFGPFVDLAAPGELILSTLPNARYDFMNGTSMAAPQVTGVAALVLARHPEFTRVELMDILRNAVDEVRTDHFVGTGRLNAYRAVRVVRPLPTARLKLPAILSGRITLEGTAAGDDFSDYRLEYGPGDHPDEWVVFHASDTPVVDGALVTDFDTSALREGEYNVRLIVHDHAGQTARDQARVTVRNVVLSAPRHNDWLRAGEVIELRGTVFGAGRAFTLEHGAGRLPHTWSTEGITLVDGGRHPITDDVLGWWDTRALPPNSFHTLRLVARQEGEVVGEWLTHLVYLDGRLRPGWPRHLASDAFYPTNDWREVVVADLDGDARQEILRVQTGGVTGAPAELKVFDLDGSLRWSAPLGRGQPYSDIPVVGDVDGDGRGEVFAETGEKGQVFAFHADGAPLAGAWPVTLDATTTGKVLADLNQDGRLELICYAAEPKPGGNFRRQLAVFDATGQRLASWPLGSCTREADAPRMFPAVGNFDRDRDLEIVAVDGCRKLALFDLNHPDEPVWTTVLDTQLYTSPVVGDVNGDGEEDIVIAGYDPRAGRKHGFAGGVFLVDRKGRVMPGWPVLIEEAFLSPPALADVDGDGRLEIAVASTQARKLHLLGSDGFDRPGWPMTINGYQRLRSLPLIADVNGDGELDLVATVNGMLSQFVAHGITEALGGVRAWTAHGIPIIWPDTDWPVLPLEQAGGFSRGKSPPATLTDLDGNGRLDLVTASIDDSAYSATTPGSSRKGRYTLYAWELPIPVAASNLVWAAHQRNAAHTGRIPGPGQTNQPPQFLPLPDQIVRAGDPFFPLPLRQYVADPDDEPARLTWEVQGASALRVEIGPDWVARVTPRMADWEGSETLTFIVRDPQQAEARQSATYSARRDYQPPAAEPDDVTIAEDTFVDVNVLANDHHPRGLALSVDSVSRPSAGQARIRDEGRIRYTPRADFYGDDQFTYLLRDAESGLALGEVRVRVTPVPDPPRVQDDHFITLEDTPIERDLLANDDDPDGDPLTVELLTLPAHTRLDQLDNGLVRLTPERDWSGADTFRYAVSDGTGFTVEGTARIMVKPVNDLPLAEDQSYTLNRNSQQDVFYQAHDPDGDKLTYSVIDTPEHGELWKFPTIATYYPEKGFVGEDRMTYQANDGRGNSRVATVFFHVIDANNAPKTKGQTVTNKMGRPLTLTLSGTDADDDPLTFEITRPPEHGALSGEASERVYHPDAEYVGWDEFWFRASDGRDASAESRVAIYQTDQNTAPVAEDRELDVRFNTPTEIELPALDPESDPLTFRIAAAPEHGQLEGDGPRPLYTPDTDYQGPDRFTFVASDGELESGEGTVHLAIQPSNSRPVVDDQELDFAADETSHVPLAVHDPDGDPLRLAILKGPQRGLLFGTGTNYVYRPNPGFHGADSFTYKAWDGYTYSIVGTVYFVVQAPPPPTPCIESVELADDGSVRLRLRVRPGRPLYVQVSADLREWKTLEQLEPDTEEATFTDPDPPEALRFYRLVEY